MKLLYFTISKSLYILQLLLWCCVARSTHRVHGLNHACRSGDATRVFLQAVGLFVYGLYLDIWLAERDPSTTWKVNISVNLGFIAATSMLFDIFVAIIYVLKYG